MTEAQIVWSADGAPRSQAFDDVYFAPDDGRAESAHVFWGGCGLPGRMAGREMFHIAELGFGLGVSFLTTWAAWRDLGPGRPALRYTSFEVSPARAEDMRRAAAPWPELAELAEALLASGWPPPEDFSIRRAAENLELELAVGDATLLLPRWRGCADAWYFDGFSPAKNPALWSAEVFSAAFERTRIGGTAATFSAAGWVRRNLSAAGFSVEKRQGYGRKRDMTVAKRPA